MCAPRLSVLVALSVWPLSHLIAFSAGWKDPRRLVWVGRAVDRDCRDDLGEPAFLRELAWHTTTPFALDLTVPPWSDDLAWTDPDDYEPCLKLAEEARTAGAEIIRYVSVRHPDQADNAAVLTCAAFQQPAPISAQTWTILYAERIIRATCETTRQRYMLVKDGAKLAFWASG